jgi:hypothetical protein
VSGQSLGKALKSRESSNLVQELAYQVLGFEESKYSTLLHFELPVTEIPIWLGPSDQGEIHSHRSQRRYHFGFQGLKSQRT